MRVAIIKIARYVDVKSFLEWMFKGKPVVMEQWCIYRRNMMALYRKNTQDYTTKSSTHAYIHE